MNIIVLMPCLDDSATAAELVVEVGNILASKGHNPSFLLVDDGSSPPLADTLRAHLPDSHAQVHVLRLSRNLGHQRAIACGLCHIWAKQMDCDAVAIMDSDGEDRPEDVPLLVERLAQTATVPSVVFAERKRRTEGVVFRAGYVLYLGLHRVLIGEAARVGNFSALSASLIPALATDSDLWSHYPATVWKSRIKRLQVPAARGTRRRGRSRLNLGALVLHGLAAISCYREKLVLRALFGSALLLAGAGAGLAIALSDPSFRAGTTFSPLIVSAGLAFCMMLQFSVMALWQCFNVLQNRHQATFIPARDYVHFVPDQTTLIVGKPTAPTPRSLQVVSHE